MPSTTEALLDVNVLIAAVFEDHPHFDRARRYVDDLERFYACPTTQGGFLRFATRPWKGNDGDERKPRLSMADAHAKLVELTAIDAHAFLQDNIGFTELPLKSMQGHRQWTDAYLLGLARRHRVCFASIESRMSNLDDPSNPVLVIVP